MQIKLTLELNQKDIERFLNKVDSRGPDECWEWTASTDKDGYGQFSLGVEFGVSKAQVSKIVRGDNWKHILGRWPGDETDEQVQEALEEIS